MSKKPKGPRAAALEASHEGITVLVYRAGIGGLRFGASILGAEEIEYFDGDDKETYPSPGAALRGAADRLDAVLARDGFHRMMDEREAAASGARKRGLY